MVPLAEIPEFTRHFDATDWPECLCPVGDSSLGLVPWASVEFIPGVDTYLTNNCPTMVQTCQQLVSAEDTGRVETVKVVRNI